MSSLFIHYGENLRVVPAIHHRIAFSQLVIRGLNDGWRPDVIALELPASTKVPILKGLKRKFSRPLWIGKRVEEALDATPLTSLTSYQHSRRVLNATIRVLLEARRYASEKLHVQPDCELMDWISHHDAGFEPFIIIGKDHDFEATYYCNVVLPERRFLASEAYCGPRKWVALGLCNEEQAGRIWFTPPFYSSYPWRRSQWVRKGNDAHIPTVRDNAEIRPDEGWRQSLIRRGIQFCRKHLLYISPSGLPPDEHLQVEAKSRGVRIVHIPTESLNPKPLSVVSKDEHEWSLSNHPDLRDADLEVFSLHAGDAYIAALRHAIANNIEIAWIDRELTEPYQLDLANDRPTAMRNGSEVHFIEDSLIVEEGLEKFYKRIQTAVESIRVPAVDAERERVMAARLKGLILEGKQVLFICGAAHWGSIKKLLDDRQFDYAPPSITAEDGLLFCSGAYSLLARGDELPICLLAYEQLRRNARSLEFSPFQAAEDLEVRVRKCLRRSGNVSASDLSKFRIFLARLCKASGVVVPRLYHLLIAARSCFGPDGCKAVYRECMKFYGCPEGVPSISGVHVGDDGIEVKLDGKTFRVKSRRGGLNYVYDKRTGEIKEKGRGGTDSRPVDLRYAAGDWETHMKNMILLARRFAQPKLLTKETLPLTSVLCGAIDARATARARGRGEARLYQKIPRRAVLHTLNEFEGFDPVVWGFVEKVSCSVEQLVLDNETPDLVIGLAATPRFNRGGLSYQCNFQLLATWIPRFADSDPTMMKRIKRWMAQGNRKYIPTKTAYRDAFRDVTCPLMSVSERTVLLALVHCREYVIYIDEREPSEHLLREARVLRKTVLYVRLSQFDPNEIERLRTPIFGAKSDTSL